MKYEEKLNELFKNSYTEINKNHDEAVIAFGNYCNINNCEIPVLVNYDTHSDVYLNMKQVSANIANWVNFCCSRLGVVEYYWIIPHYVMSNPEYKRVFETGENFQQETFQHGAMRAWGGLNNVLEEHFLLDKNTSELITEKKLNIINEKNKKFNISGIIPESEGLKSVKLFIVPFDKISVLKGKEIALSIDADSFCNSGHDTINAINNIDISSEEIKQEFEIFINELYDNKIKIETASLTRSPAYFPIKFENEIQEFFDSVKKSSNYRRDLVSV